MGLFVNLSSSRGFTMQSGAPNWLNYAWMDSHSLILCGPYSSFLLPTDCLNGSLRAHVLAVSVGVCGWVGDSVLFPTAASSTLSFCGTQLVSVELELGPFHCSLSGNSSSGLST